MPTDGNPKLLDENGAAALPSVLPRFLDDSSQAGDVQEETAGIDGGGGGTTDTASSEAAPAAAVAALLCRDEFVILGAKAT
jgi:hypothetical protein